MLLDPQTALNNSVSHHLCRNFDNRSQGVLFVKKAETRRKKIFFCNPWWEWSTTGQRCIQDIHLHSIFLACDANIQHVYNVDKEIDIVVLVKITHDCLCRIVLFSPKNSEIKVTAKISTNLFLFKVVTHIFFWWWAGFLEIFCIWIIQTMTTDRANNLSHNLER